jgi:hypothetical protein
MELKENYTREQLNFANLISVIMKIESDTEQGNSIFWHSRANILLEIDFENKCINYNVEIKSNMKNKRFYQIVGACHIHGYEFTESYF